jgi:hypothetical protein
LVQRWALSSPPRRWWATRGRVPVVRPWSRMPCFRSQGPRSSRLHPRRRVPRWVTLHGFVSGQSSCQEESKFLPARARKYRQAAGACAALRKARDARLGARIALTTLVVLASPGCSLLFTRGPEPEVHPPPPCTTSNAGPISDGLLAALSLVVVVIGGVAAASPSCQTNSGSLGYCVDAHSAGPVIIASGAALGALFTTSAVVGSRRTNACRDYLESRSVPPPAPLAPVSSLLPASPMETCAAVGDAPRACPRRPLTSRRPFTALRRGRRLLSPGGAGEHASHCSCGTPRPRKPSVFSHFHQWAPAWSVSTERLPNRSYGPGVRHRSGHGVGYMACR